MSKLSEQDILYAITKLNGWEFKNNAIHKIFTFESYLNGIAFINRLAEIAEENNHHPDMVVGWCKIDVAFTSHDQGGVTTACIEMAKMTELVL
ncbi:MAG: 4a-hydroxytetrahydrobiopterin dehydratase [Candidatus Neomarinimicrobiota bacterium]|nr:4a-hydroxytetrahydrobiopterin dehydratase [Candidatus Neomarinimicrobiota bacterium]